MTPPNYESFEEKSEVFKENFKIDNEEEVSLKSATALIR